MPNYCAVCPNETELGCSACKAVLFCSTKCQRIIWQSHKLICKGRLDTFEGPELTKAEWRYLIEELGYTNEKGTAAYEAYKVWGVLESQGDSSKLNNLAEKLSINRMGLFATASGLLVMEDGDGSLGAQRTEMRLSISDLLREGAGTVFFPLDFPIPFYHVIMTELSLKSEIYEACMRGAPTPNVFQTMSRAEDVMWRLVRRYFNAALRQDLVSHTLVKKIRKGTSKLETREGLIKLLELSGKRFAFKRAEAMAVTRLRIKRTFLSGMLST